MENHNRDQWLNDVHWGPDGLIPVITQDIRSGRVLTHAWVNRDALQAAREESRAVYWSRSRNKLWRKGEESGHVQKLHRILLDCDGDTLLYLVQQIGGIACHTGRESCFYRVLDTEQVTAGQESETNAQRPFWRINDPVLKDPSEIYGGDPSKANKDQNRNESRDKDRDKT